MNMLIIDGQYQLCMSADELRDLLEETQCNTSYTGIWERITSTMGDEELDELFL